MRICLLFSSLVAADYSSFYFRRILHQFVDSLLFFFLRCSVFRLVKRFFEWLLLGNIFCVFRSDLSIIFVPDSILVVYSELEIDISYHFYLSLIFFICLCRLKNCLRLNIYLQNNYTRCLNC